MITVFNGRSRQLGRGDKNEVFIQVTVGLREHLHLFRGARLTVFMAIALHSNERGWSHPSTKLLAEETGLDRASIFRALKDLCALQINGERVLLRDSGKGRKNSSGTHVTNRYLIFPSAADIEEHETPDPELPFNETAMSQNPPTAMSQNPPTAMSQNPPTAMSQNAYIEEEPVLTRTSFNQNQFEEEHTHTLSAYPPRAREPGESEAASPRVCGLEKFSLKQLRVYAQNQSPPLREAWIHVELREQEKRGHGCEQIADWFAQREQRFRAKAERERAEAFARAHRAALAAEPPITQDEIKRIFAQARRAPGGSG